MTVRGLLGGGNDGGGAVSTVQTTPAAGATTSDLHLFVTGFAGGTQTCTNEWSGFTTLQGPVNHNNSTFGYLFGKVYSSGDLTDGSNGSTWTASGRLSADGLTLQDVDFSSIVSAVTANSAAATTRVAPSVTTGGATGDGSLWEVYVFGVIRVVSGAAHPTLTLPSGYTLRDRHNPSTSGGNAADTFVVSRNSNVGPNTSVSPGTFTLSASSVCQLYTVAIKQQVAATDIYPATLASTLSFGTPTLTADAVQITPNTLASTLALGSPTLDPQPVAITPGTLSNPISVGQPSINAGPVTVAPNSLSNPVSLGQPSVAPGSVNISPGSINPSTSFGSPGLQSVYNLTPATRSSTLVFGSPSLDAINSIAPSARPSTLSFGSPSLVPQPVSIAPATKASGLSFGTPTLSPAGVSIVPGTRPSSLAFGTPAMQAGPASLYLTGMPSGVTFGVPALISGTVDTSPASIPSGLVIGQPSLIAGAKNIFLGGLESGLSFGQIGVYRPVAGTTGTWYNADLTETVTLLGKWNADTQTIEPINTGGG